MPHGRSSKNTAVSFGATAAALVYNRVPSAVPNSSVLLSPLTTQNAVLSLRSFCLFKLKALQSRTRITHRITHIKGIPTQ